MGWRQDARGGLDAERGRDGGKEVIINTQAMLGVVDHGWAGGCMRAWRFFMLCSFLWEVLPVPWKMNGSICLTQLKSSAFASQAILSTRQLTVMSAREIVFVSKASPHSASGV